MPANSSDVVTLRSDHIAFQSSTIRSRFFVSDLVTSVEDAVYGLRGVSLFNRLEEDLFVLQLLFPRQRADRA